MTRRRSTGPKRAPRESNVVTQRTTAEVDARIKEIRTLMHTGVWTKAHHLLLADKWKVKPETVRDWVRIATRLARGSIDDEEFDEMRVATVAKLERIAAVGMQMTEDGPVDLRSAHAALNTIAEIYGLKKPQRVQVDVRALVMPLLETWQRWAVSNLTPEQLAAWESTTTPLLTPPPTEQKDEV